MNKKRLIGSIIFNIAETILIFLVGMFLKIPTNFILIIMLTFMISRGCFGKALHFKTWYRCLIWSLLILLSLFMLFHVDLTVSILFTIFSALIMTGKGNINDMYLFDNSKERISKYQKLIDYLKYNMLDNEYIEAENLLKDRVSKLEYLIYKRRFVDGEKNLDIIEDEFSISRGTLVNHLDKCYFYLIGRLKL